MIKKTTILLYAVFLMYIMASCGITADFTLEENETTAETETSEVTATQVDKKIPAKRIALTFDDGPHYKHTLEILDILAEHDIRATFFVIGINVEKYPSIVKRMIADGETEITGRLPVNTDGGLIGNGEPIGASGLRQIHELVLQLRGAAGARQVPGKPVVGYAHLYGAPGVSAVTILST